MWTPEEYRRIWLPYCVKKMKDNIGGWIVLNRRYKPLGMSLDKWVIYEEVPKAVRIKRITIQAQAKLDHGSRLGAFWLPDDMIWLYHDGCVPTSSAAHWKAYQTRLFLLSRLKCFGGER